MLMLQLNNFKFRPLVESNFSGIAIAHAKENM